ncbi:MAG: hypothetical protein CMJ18_27055, partial [Phycisphaeraceae bacterium]|nr:hypothetical protein [Phycisphaeraceae bacterium]
RPGGGGGRAGAGGRTLGKKSKGTTNHLEWSWWWSLNKDRFIELRSAVRAEKARSVNRDTLLGGTDGIGDVKEVSRKQVAKTIIPTLLLALKDAHYDVRQSAAIALGKVATSDDGSVRKALVQLLSDDDRRVRESVCLGLGMLGAPGSLELLAAVAGDETAGRKAVQRTHVLSRTRAFATIAVGLVAARQPTARGRASFLLTDLLMRRERQLDNRVAPAIALQIFSGPDHGPFLLNVFRDPSQDVRVRAHAVVALGKAGVTSAVGDLVEGLADKESSVAYSCAISLGLLTNPTDKKTVRRIAKVARLGRNLGLRRFAMMALAEIGGDRARSALIQMLTRGRGEDVAWAALALGVIGYQEPHARVEIGRYLMKAWGRSKSESTRGAVAIAFGISRQRHVVKMLRKTLKRAGTQELKSRVCTSLALLGDRPSIPAIQELVRQRGDPDLRRRAAIALGLLGDVHAVELLQEVIASSTRSHAILGAATVALGHIGDRSAVPTLVDFLENPDDKCPGITRAFAAVALGHLGDKDELPLLTQVHAHCNYLASTPTLAELLSIL